MFSIKALKKDARGALKRNYVMVVVTCLIATIVLGTFRNPVDIIEDNIFPLIDKAAGDTEISEVVDASVFAAPDTSDIIKEFLENIGAGNSTSEHWTEGVLSVFARATEGAGNLITGILNIINQFVFKNKISSGVIVSLGILASIAFYIFFMQVILVGLYRFLLENRRYTKSIPSRLLFPWTIKRGVHIAWVMFVRRLYELLWYFTIVGGVIKHYSYRMVPLIMAENPDMTAKEAITLSRQMMDGYKWKTFLFDLSFIGWIILDFATLSLIGLFYTRPYKYAAEAELYMYLRAEAKKNRIENTDKLCDTLLEAEISSDAYPAQDYLITPAPVRKWITSDYKRDYSVTSLVLMFFSFAFIGWVWEVIVFLFTDGEFINRGTSYGPWLPIYGFGGLVILVVLKRFRDNPGLLFVITGVSCGIMEYVTAWFLETFIGMKYWDYTGYFLNIQGRVCLEGLIVFSIAGLAATYIIAPALDDLFKKIPQKYKNIICAVLITAFVADQAITFIHPHTGKGITEYDH